MLAAVLFVPAASAQTTSNPRMQVRVSLEKLSLYMRQSPNVLTQDDPRPLPKPKKWADFEIPFKVEAAPTPKSGYIDALTFKFYIAVVNPDRARQYLKLYKEVKYVNVPVGENTYASVYLSPSSVKRITGVEGGRGITSHGSVYSRADKFTALPVMVISGHYHFQTGVSVAESFKRSSADGISSSSNHFFSLS